jgi:hypothetical protein
VKNAAAGKTKLTMENAVLEKLGALSERLMALRDSL